MYYIVNKTRNKTFTHEGSFPSTALDRMLNNQEDLIIISTYSNTVKIPIQMEENGNLYWDWMEYPLKDYKCEIIQHYLEEEVGTRAEKRCKRRY